jgi:hypothetical protein
MSLMETQELLQFKLILVTSQMLVSLTKSNATMVGTAPKQWQRINLLTILVATM